MDKKLIMDKMAEMRPPFLDLLKSTITDIDLESQSCTMEFDIDKQFCHSVDVVQGGFVTAMLDTVSSHAVFGVNYDVIGLSTLELKVSYLAVSRAGKFRAVGQIEKLTHNFAFLSAELMNEEGERTAILTSTAKLIRKK